MVKFYVLLIALVFQTCSAEEVPFPNEKMETLFAGMRQIEKGLGAHAFVASVKLTVDSRNEIKNYNLLCVGAVNSSGQRLVGFSQDAGAATNWKLKLADSGKQYFLRGLRHQLVPIAKTQEEQFSVAAFDPIAQTMAPITSVLIGGFKSPGQHHRRSGENLSDFHEDKHFDLLYMEPGIGIVKTKLIRFRFDLAPSPHVIQVNLQSELKSGVMLDSLSTSTQWVQLHGHYVPKTIDGITTTPGDGPKCLGTIELRWSFDVPKFDIDASDWIDTLASAFPVDPFSGE